MLLLILGLVIFLGAHSIRIIANDWRSAQIARVGAQRWKGLYALTSLIGLVLIIVGFGIARQYPVLVYTPAAWLRDINIPLTLLAFVLVSAAYVPGNRIKTKIGHPMLAGVQTWAFGHLLATGMLCDVVLFGAFLLWAIADFAVSHRRDRIAGVVYPPGALKGDLSAVAAGVIAWIIVAFWLHTRLIGVNPLA